MQDVEHYTHLFHRDYSCRCQCTKKCKKLKATVISTMGKIYKKMLCNFKERAADCILQSTNINKDLPAVLIVAQLVKDTMLSL